MDDSSPLPTDLEECHRLLMAAYQQSKQLEQATAEAQSRATASEQEVAELTRVLDETAASYQELQQRHEATLDELAAYKRWVFGRRQERFSEAQGQGHLFELDTVSTSDSNTAAIEPDSLEIPGHRRRRQRREIDWDTLPQVVHDHDLDDHEKECSGCGQLMDQIGEDITRELEFQQPKLEAHIHVRPKYACRRCQNGVASASVDARPIPGGIAGPGLISEVIVSKFGDHLPLYRLEDILTRCGVYLARSTLCDWVKATAQLLQPLYDLQRQRVVQSSVMWTDDTNVTVLGGNQGSFQGYFWAYIGDATQPYSVYDFTVSRSRDGPVQFLEGFSGYLHADAYAGYDGMFSQAGSNVVEVACWAHARRRFFDAAGNYPREAHQVLEWIKQLYEIEHQAHDVTVDERRELRVQHAVPVLDKIECYLDELAAKALPKSALGKAVTYARNQWQALRQYTEDGRLTIDNNVCERTIRHQAIGRKNWLFLGSQAAGPRAAVLYTILAGAKRHRIEPWVYVRDLLLRLHADQPLEEMLPDRWAAAHPAAILNHRLQESRQKAVRKRARRAHRRRQK